MLAWLVCENALVARDNLRLPLALCVEHRRWDDVVGVGAAGGALLGSSRFVQVWATGVNCSEDLEEPPNVTQGWGWRSTTLQDKRERLLPDL